MADTPVHDILPGMAFLWTSSSHSFAWHKSFESIHGYTLFDPKTRCRLASPYLELELLHAMVRASVHESLAITVRSLTTRSEHVPAVEACSLLTLKAIYSHSKVAAQNLSQAEDIDWYYDNPATPLYALDDLLAREDIHAVIIAVPVFLQSSLIKQALAAGKHVLSEKPIAEDVTTAQDLIQWYRGERRKEIWSVAENFRFLPGIRLGADQIRSIGGTVVTFSMNLSGFVDEDEDFYQTQACDTSPLFIKLHLKN